MREKAEAALDSLVARLEAAERERDEERERFHRHVEEMIEPKLLARLKAAEQRARLAEANVRVREQSQIPMVPVAAQARFEALEAKAEKMQEALQEIVNLESRQVQFSAVGGVSGAMRKIAVAALGVGAEGAPRAMEGGC